jgi:hypothetical protein
MTPRLAPRGAHEQCLAGGGRVREAVVGAVLVSGTFVVDQPLDVGGIFDLCPLVVAAPMAGEHFRTVNDAHLSRIGEHRQHAPDMSVRHRIVVQVKAHIRCLAHRHRDMLEQRRGIVGQCEQAGFLLVESLPDGALQFTGTAPVGGGAEAPGFRLGIEIIQSCERARREEGVADVPYRALDPAFLVAPGDRHGSCLVAILSGKAQQSGMEADASPRRSSTTLLRLS